MREPANLAPFKIWCDGCGADVDASDKEFTLGAWIMVPEADFALCEVSCRSCGRRTDAALWLISRAEFLAQPEARSFLEGAVTPDAAALLERHLAEVQQYRCRCLEMYAAAEDLPSVDLSEERVVFEPTEHQLAAVPARILAAVRGLRLAIAQHPFSDPPGMLLVGRFNVTASVDAPTRPGDPPQLHMSVGRRDEPGEFSKAEAYGLCALFFDSSEIPHVQIKPGQRVPVLHFYLTYEPDV